MNKEGTPEEYMKVHDQNIRGLSSVSGNVHSAPGIMSINLSLEITEIYKLLLKQE